MPHSDMNRRNFHQLSLAAFGGMMTGSLLGCQPPAPEPEAAPPAEPSEPAASDAPTPAPEQSEGEPVSLLLQEPHVCRGLNMCKNQGASKENACAGQGTCASVAEHACTGQNACKGQGGCGANPGENTCKGQGGCHVPLMEHAWESARKNFEQAMESAGKKVGPAPKKA